jgi:RNA polymerase sigma factor (TIGR02999 family)
MGSPAPQEVTRLLLAWSGGDESAIEQLVPVVYQELRRLAHRCLNRERPDHTLQATALVHEAYQRLIDTPYVHWQDRAHFFAICAQLMRRVLVDYARSRRYLKRGGDICLVPLEEAFAASADRGKDLFAIDEALKALSAIDPRKGRVVELRFFGGLTAEETAEVLKVSPDTVLRDWKLAKSWLLKELKRGPARGT